MSRACAFACRRLLLWPAMTMVGMRITMVTTVCGVGSGGEAGARRSECAKTIGAAAGLPYLDGSGLAGCDC